MFKRGSREPGKRQLWGKCYKRIYPKQMQSSELSSVGVTPKLTGEKMSKCLVAMCSNQKAPKEAYGFYHQCALNRNFLFFWISWLFNKLLLFWHLQKKHRLSSKMEGKWWRPPVPYFPLPSIPLPLAAPRIFILLSEWTPCVFFRW